ncbi:hypothetical protein [Sediminitomix flava]|uniref:Uncharacterized protein n=1 Tax=Sediminitomix flava TaxID=379075 RepID=A0A315Z5A0_SEDFL|nr:hypothetical protein [Sediminitomix flava]PWJ38653.1 hypothetical protein BC781_107244 [Sediminitomix flava]
MKYPQKRGSEKLNEILSAQEKFKSEQEQLLHEVLKRKKEGKEKYFSKFQKVYNDIIKPVFDDLGVSFKDYGHELKLKYENLNIENVQPEIRFELFLNGDSSPIRIMIFGKGVNQNVMFSMEKSIVNSKIHVFQFDEITRDKVEDVLIQMLKSPIK